VIGDAEVDFEDGLQILAVRVPPGVNWASESGIFPHLPSPVPTDPTAVRVPQLRTVFPNPFNPQTTISFSLAGDERAEVSVYDLTGRLVRTLANRTCTAGDHSVVWNGKDATGRELPSGSYIIRLETESSVESQKISLIR